MSVISDAAMLPRLPDSTNTFADVANANYVAEEGISNIADQAKQQKQAQIMQHPFQKIEYVANKQTGGYDIGVKMGQDTFDYLGTLLQTGQATIRAFGEARAQLQAKREFQERNPFISAIGKISSTAAAQYAGGGRGRDISPIVRAAGAYGLEQFGQTNAELAQQEAQLTGQQFGVANQLYNQEQQNQQIGIANRRADAAERRTIAQEDLAERRYGQTVVAQLDQDARQGLYGPEDAETLNKRLIESGAVRSPEAAASVVKTMLAVSEAKKRIAAQEHKDKLTEDEARQDRIDRRFLSAQAGLMSRFSQTQEKKDDKETGDEADMLLLAQGAVDGDPTSLNIWSTRTGGRAKFLAMAKRLDPTMTEAKLNSRAKAVMDLGDRSKNGTLGTQMEMFDTFIQHTDELEKKAAEMNLTGSPLLNKGLNKLRSEVMGDPRLQRLLVVAAAAGKEYEGVLLRGRALYASDREEIEKFLSSKLTLRQILATAQEQREVTVARIRSGNNSFKRTVGKNLPPDSLSEESKEILRRNKFDLPFLKEDEKAPLTMDMSKYER